MNGDLFKQQVLTLLVALSLFGCKATTPENEERAVDLSEVLADVRTGDLPESPVQVFRQFECNPAGVGPETAVGEYPTSIGDGFVIRPADGERCNYHVYYRDEGGRDTQLSTRPGGYLLAVAARNASGDIAFCISKIMHEAMEPAEHRYMNSVTYECAARISGEWTALSPVVTPDGDWAAWANAISWDVDGDSLFSTRYSHDFSYQFLNTGNLGRPDADGLYEIQVRRDGERLVVIETEKVSDEVNPSPSDDGTFESWEPTPEEIDELGDVIDFSALTDCPEEGCVEPLEPSPGT